MQSNRARNCTKCMITRPSKIALVYHTSCGVGCVTTFRDGFVVKWKNLQMQKVIPCDLLCDEEIGWYFSTDVIEITC